MGEPFQLRFTSFDLENHPTCSFDYVQINDNVKYCGNNVPANVLSSNGSMKVHFHSEYNVQKTGFQAEIVLPGE